MNQKKKTNWKEKFHMKKYFFCLKKSSNNTSLGFDGFTYDFFKFFLEWFRLLFAESYKRLFWKWKVIGLIETWSNNLYPKS